MLSMQMRAAGVSISMVLALLSPAGAQTGTSDLVDDIVMANHILFDQGVLDGYGHVSARNPQNADHFFMSRARAPSQITADDIVEYDLDGKPVDGSVRKSAYAEIFIHAETYRARPDVKGIVHSHAPEVIAAGLVATPLVAVTQTTRFLCDGAPVFDLSDEFPDTKNMLIDSPAKGKALARTLGQHTVVLMRGHGDLVVANSVRNAVFNAIYTALAARLLRDAAIISGGGPVKSLTKAECENFKVPVVQKEMFGTDRNWEHWVAITKQHMGEK
jgi:ribulose-5-phosphate 4-epimerase/fuculose-1-phosphate aldolase